MAAANSVNEDFRMTNSPYLFPEPDAVGTTHDVILNPCALTRLHKIKALAQLPTILCLKCNKTIIIIPKVWNTAVSTYRRRVPGSCLKDADSISVWRFR